jgi:hypothetical protein
VQFNFKDSSSLDDSDIEDVLFDDDAEVLLTVKGARGLEEEASVRIDRRPSLHPTQPRGWPRHAHARLFHLGIYLFISSILLAISDA